ncbi:MAG TPA: futalosine hydrolase [Phnomibacter sp.]|nr:futalosine hydrolase [Phnomibacter sp.]
MKILLVAATQLELQEYILSAPHHDILITGIGVPPSMFELTRLLHHHRYDLVIQAGVAGAYPNAPYKLGDVVAVERDAFGTLGVFEEKQIRSLTELNLSSEKEWWVNDNPLLKKLGLPLAKGLTLSGIVDDDTFINALINRWNADVESMEGACLHYVCSKLNMPYIQLRAISNVVGERDKNKWLLGGALTNLNNYVSQFIQSLQKN